MGINVVSLFSGGGGLDLGFVAEGYNVIWAIDNNKNATETYKVNLGDHIICADINQVDISKIPHADVVIDLPPIYGPGAMLVNSDSRQRSEPRFEGRAAARRGSNAA